MTLTVRTTAPDRTLALRLADPVQLTDGPAAADGELTLPLAALPRLVSGRLRATDTDVVATGPASRADLERVFPGY